MTHAKERDAGYFERDAQACQDARANEKGDCVHRGQCLLEVAKTEGKRGRKEARLCLPCEGCERYQKKEPDEISPWKKSSYEFEGW